MPAKGREKTRKKISGKAKDVKDKMEKAVEGFGKKAEEFKDMAIEQFTDAEKTIKSKFYIGITSKNLKHPALVPVFRYK